MLSIKRIPEQEIIKVVFDQTNQTISERYLYATKQQIKSLNDHFRDFNTNSQAEFDAVFASPLEIMPSQGGVLKVLSSNKFFDSAGYLHLVGEIQNGTPDSVTFVKATATFYDKNNNVVATDFTYTSPSDLSPGDKAPFEIILTSASIPVKQIDHHTIIASS